MGPVTLRDRDGLHVGAGWDEHRRLVIQGRDLRGGGEYEYAVSVRAEDVPLIVDALGGAAGDDVLQLLSAHGDWIVQQGELAWLGVLGITPDFWSRVG